MEEKRSITAERVLAQHANTPAEGQPIRKLPLLISVLLVPLQSAALLLLAVFSKVVTLWRTLRQDGGQRSLPVGQEEDPQGQTSVETLP